LASIFVKIRDVPNNEKYRLTVNGVRCADDLHYSTEKPEQAPHICQDPLFLVFSFNFTNIYLSTKKKMHPPIKFEIITESNLLNVINETQG